MFFLMYTDIQVNTLWYSQIKTPLQIVMPVEKYVGN